MADLIYGYACDIMLHKTNQVTEDNLRLLKEQGGHGLFVVDPIVNSTTEKVGDWCKTLGLDLVLCFTDSPAKPDVARLRQSIVRQLAVRVGAEAADASSSLSGMRT